MLETVKAYLVLSVEHFLVSLFLFTSKCANFQLKKNPKMVIMVSQSNDDFNSCYSLGKNDVILEKEPMRGRVLYAGCPGHESFVCERSAADGTEMALNECDWKEQRGRPTASTPTGMC